MQIRVATWNLAKRRRRLAEVMAYLRSCDIDLALLQETPPAGEWRSGFKAVWTPSLAPDCRILAHRRHGLRLLDRSPLERFGDYAAVASFKPDGGRDIQVASFHALARKAFADELDGLDPQEIRRPQEAQPWVNDLAFHLLSAQWDEPFMIGCDINTSPLFDGGAYVKRAEVAGWIDCIHRVYGYSQQTFFRRGYRPHQLDYLFVSKDLAETLVKAEIDGSVIGSYLSDHAPILATFDLTSWQQEG